MSKIYGKCKVCRKKTRKSELRKQRGKCQTCFKNKLTIDRSYRKKPKRQPLYQTPLLPSMINVGGIPQDFNNDKLISMESNKDEKD